MTEYVERDKVLAEEEFFGEHATWDNPMADGCMAVRSDFIMNLPAADVAPVIHGILKYSPQDDIALCSKCGEEIYLGALHQFAHNYCPNCGAKLEGETNG